MIASSQEYISAGWGLVAIAMNPVIPRPTELVPTITPIIFSQR